MVAVEWKKPSHWTPPHPGCSDTIVKSAAAARRALLRSTRYNGLPRIVYQGAASMAVATSIIDAFRQLTPNSAKLAERAAQLLPSGVTHDSWYMEPYPLFTDRAQGSHKWDVDGREYVDYAGGHGALLLG